MAKVFEGTPEQYYMDGYLVSNTLVAIEANKKDWDFVFLVDGRERSGKSCFTQQWAKLCYPELTLDNIAFTSTAFEEKVYNAKPHTAIIYDEAYGGLNARQAMGRINRSLIKMLTVIGHKNLFIFVLLPSFFDLDKYVALWRSAALVHIETSDNFQRGFFKFYNYERKKNLYIKGKEYYDYNVIKSNFYGRFTNHWVVDVDIYKTEKARATSADRGGPEERNKSIVQVARQIQRDIAMNMHQLVHLNNREIAKILDVSAMTIHNYLKQNKIVTDNEDISLDKPPN